MSAIKNKPVKEIMSAIHVKCDPIPILQTENGYILSNVYLPEEVLALILSYVDKISLVKKCSLVCITWYHVIRNEVWKVKAEREYLQKLVTLPSYRRLPYIIYRDILWDKPFGRNLLKNGSGEQNFQYWTITHNAGDQWIVEKPPIGITDPPVANPKQPKTAFVTSFGKSKMNQKIDLVAEGIDCEFLDRYQPNIYISEWYAARCDCGSEYYLSVYLLDSNMEIKMDFKYEEIMRDWVSGWKEAKHIFSNYGPGVRYILFDHGGKDIRCWAGHYGSKMTDASVTCPFADLKHTNSDYQKNIKSIMSNES